MRYQGETAALEQQEMQLRLLMPPTPVMMPQLDVQLPPQAQRPQFQPPTPQYATLQILQTTAGLSTSTSAFQSQPRRRSADVISSQLWETPGPPRPLSTPVPIMDLSTSRFPGRETPTQSILALLAAAENDPTINPPPPPTRPLTNDDELLLCDELYQKIPIKAINLRFSKVQIKNK